MENKYQVFVRFLVYYHGRERCCHHMFCIVYCSLTNSILNLSAGPLWELITSASHIERISKLAFQLNEAKLFKKLISLQLTLSLSSSLVCRRLDYSRVVRWIVSNVRICHAVSRWFNENCTERCVCVVQIIATRRGAKRYRTWAYINFIIIVSAVLINWPYPHSIRINIKYIDFPSPNYLVEDSGWWWRFSFQLQC